MPIPHSCACPLFCMPTSDNLLVSPFWINAGWAELRNQVGECSIFHSRATIEAAVSRQDRMDEQDRHVLVYALAVSRSRRGGQHCCKAPSKARLASSASRCVCATREKEPHLDSCYRGLSDQPSHRGCIVQLRELKYVQLGQRHRHALNLHRVTIYRQGRRTLRRNKKALDCPTPGFQWCEGVMQCLHL